MRTSSRIIETISITSYQEEVGKDILGDIVKDYRDNEYNQLCWNKDYCTHTVDSCKSVLINIMSVLRLIVAGVQCVCVVVVYRTVYVYGLVLSWYTWVYM